MGPQVAPDGGAAHFQVHPSVLFKLGADLVTDDTQALTELIKNAYDAGSATAIVAVETQSYFRLRTGASVPEPDALEELARTQRAATVESQVNGTVDHHTKEPTSTGTDETPSAQPVSGAEAVKSAQALDPVVQGRITLRDTGHGMTEQEVIDGWLRISASQKRRRKQELKSNPALRREHERYPLGDKGLGRLAAQRLGQAITLTTKREGQPGVSITICWSDYEVAETLDQVPLRVEPAPMARVGTTIEIRGLHNSELWRSREGSKSHPGYDLELKVARMISPFRLPKGFGVTVRVDGNTIDLHQQTSAVRENAMVAHKFEYLDQSLRFDAQIRVLYMKPASDEEKIADFERLIEQDDGEAFLRWLWQDRPAKARSVGLSVDDRRFPITASQQIDVSRLPTYEREAESLVKDGSAGGSEQSAPEFSPLIDPGPFYGEVDVVLKRTDPTQLFTKLADYKAFLEAIGGIRVYRDGFGIPVDSDWIGLSSQWTSARSYYTIRPDNAVGFISLTAEHNEALEETTNREAFRDTAAYRNFLRLLSEWLTYTERLQSTLRTAYNDYRKENQAEVAEVPRQITPQALVRETKERLDRLQETRQALSNADATFEQLAQDATTLTSHKDSLTEYLFVEPKLLDGYDEVLEHLSSTRLTARHALSSAVAGLDDLERDRSGLDLLLAQVEGLEHQIREVWESVSLGLSAEALSHEVKNVVQRLRARSLAVRNYLRDQGSQDRYILAFVEEVRTLANTLDKQVSRLDPALRNVREHRTSFSVADYLREQIPFYEQRWVSDGIELRLEVENDFSVSMNQGRLTQVLDNLLYNSEYWLRNLPSGAPRAVTLRIDAPVLTIEDSGPGVAQEVEATLFDPFITAKPGGSGRGLGLFVAEQMMSGDGVNLTLDATRNAGGRRFRFRLDFEAVESTTSGDNR